MGAMADECRRRMHTNPVFKAMEAIKEIAVEVAEGTRQNAVVCGPTGIGKNFIFEQEFRRVGRPWRPERPISVPALIEHIQENNKRGSVLVFDECDYLVRNRATLNILKIAMDTKSSDRILSYKVRNEKLCIPEFIVNCNFLFLMNTDLYDAKLLSNAQIGEHIKAFNSRSVPFVIPFDHEAIYEYTAYLVVCERMLMRRGFSRDETELALSYFSETMHLSWDVSPRRVTLVAEEIRRNPRNWRNYLAPTLGKPRLKAATWIPRLECRRSIQKPNC